MDQLSDGLRRSLAERLTDNPELVLAELAQGMQNMAVVVRARPVTGSKDEIAVRLINGVSLIIKVQDA